MRGLYWEEILEGAFVVFLCCACAVAVGLGVYAIIVSPDSPPTPPQERAKKLDPQGNTWYIWSEGYRSPTDAVPYTCPSIDREVAEVVLANKYGTEGTVRCK